MGKMSSRFNWSLGKITVGVMARDGAVKVIYGQWDPSRIEKRNIGK